MFWEELGMFGWDELYEALPPHRFPLAKNRLRKVLGCFLGLVVVSSSGTKKRIIGIKGCAHLLQLGIQVSVGDVRALLLLLGGCFISSGGFALGDIWFHS